LNSELLFVESIYFERMNVICCVYFDFRECATLEYERGMLFEFWRQTDRTSAAFRLAVIIFNDLSFAESRHVCQRSNDVVETRALRIVNYILVV
jgi:hypothetical protein